MIEKILHTDFHAWSYELLQILCILPTAAVVFSLLSMDVESVTWYILYLIIGIACTVLGLFFIRQVRKQKQKMAFHNIMFCYFLIWAFLSTLLASNLSASFFGILDRGEGYAGLVIYGGIYVCGMQIANEERRWKLLRLFMSGSVLVSFLYVLQRSEDIRAVLGLTENYFLVHSVKGSAVFGHPEFYSYYLTMVVICAAGLFITSQKWADRMYAMILFLLNITVLISNNTFSCYLSIMIGLILVSVLLGIRNRKINYRTFIPMAVFLIASIAINLITGKVSQNFISLANDFQVMSTSSIASKEIGTVGNGRFGLWRQTIRYIAQNPFVGYGSEGLVKMFAEDGFKQYRPTNEYLQYTAYYGIVGFYFYLAGLLCLFRKKIRTFRYFSNNTIVIWCIVIAYLISAFFGNTSFYTTSFFFLFVGMISGEDSDL